MVFVEFSSMNSLLGRLKSLLTRRKLTIPERALELYAEGVRLAESNRHKQAIEKFSEAIKLSPNTGKLFHHRAASFAEIGSFDAAVFDFLGLSSRSS